MNLTIEDDHDRAHDVIVVVVVIIVVVVHVMNEKSEMMDDKP